MFEDTIIAISTPIGHGGLGIVRLSGKKSLSTAKKIFKPKKRGSKITPKRPVLGDLYNHEQKDYFEEAFLTKYLLSGLKSSSSFLRSKPVSNFQMRGFKPQQNRY